MIEKITTTVVKPSDEILKKYADVLVKYALGSGKGVQKGEVVRIMVPESAKPIYTFLVKSVLECGGIPMGSLLPENVDKNYFDNASDEQITYFDEAYDKAFVDHVDHSVYIISEVNKEELKEVPAEKIMNRSRSMIKFREFKNAKENAGNFSWTIGMWGTQEMADEVDMSIEDYWGEIIKACYLDEVDPIKKHKETAKFIKETATKLNELNIQKVHVMDDNGTDLEVSIGSNRSWEGGGGANIPSYEIFTSPKKYGTNGTYVVTEPLYRSGNLIEGIKLTFKDGKVIDSSATTGEDFLKELLAVEGGDYLGEFSLTDSRVSKITKFMGETLYDENVGGPQGNTHVALGSAYKSCYKGDVANTTKDEWEVLEYNDSVVHTDIVSTAKRTVTATLEDGSELVIYKDGKFTV